MRERTVEKMHELTAVGEENREAFEPLMNGLDPSDYEICIGAIADDEAAGVAFYNTIGDALMLDYIFVSPAHRNKGIGRALVEDFIEEIKEAGPRVLYVNYPEKQEELYCFSRALGFRIFRDGLSFRTPVKNLLESEALDKLLQAGKKNPIVTLDGLTMHEKKELKRKLEDNDMESGIIDSNALCLPLSLAVLDKKNKEVVALVLCSRSRTQIMIDYLVNFTSNPVYLVDLLDGLKEAVIREELEDCDLIFVAMNEGMEKLPKKLIGPDGIIQDEGAVISGVRVISEYGKED